MTIFDTFAKRQKRLREGAPDVFSYDDIPEPLRIQIIQIMRETLGNKDDYDNYSIPSVTRTYKYLVNLLRKELAVFQLPPRNKYQDHFLEELQDYLLNEKNVENVLSGIELVCRAIEAASVDYNYMLRQNANELASEAISEINHRFREHGVGYEYNGEIIRIDAALIHVETVKPALLLLQNQLYQGAEQEFLNAFAHYRKGNFKEALNDALKSMESTMKSIYDKRNWAYNKTDPASKLINVAFDNQLGRILINDRQIS
jgi:hypothetical protein